MIHGPYNNKLMTFCIYTILHFYILIDQPDNDEVETYITKVNINKLLTINICFDDVQVLFVNTDSTRGYQTSKFHRNLLSPSTG